MKTALEERLTDALAARADQVQPDQLRPVTDPSPRRRAIRPLLVGLTAAAVVAAVVGGSRLLAPAEDDVLAPAAAPVPIDVDGDGRPEPVRISWDATDGTFEIIAGPPDELLTKRGVGTAETRPRVMGGVDLDEDGADEVVVDVSDDPSTPPAVFRFTGGVGVTSSRVLTQLELPAASTATNGWERQSPANRWAVSDGRLFCWVLPDRADESRFPAWTWDIDESGRLFPEPGPAPVWTKVPANDAVRVDIDGEGFAEPVWLDYDRDAWEFRVEAGHPRDRYAPSGTVISDVPPRIIGPADVDGDGREEVAVDVGGYLPVFFRYVPADGIGFDSLRKLRMAGILDEINGWSPAGRLNDWFLRDGRLVTWHADDRGGAPRVPYWEWQVVDERLIPGPSRPGCLDGPDSLPAPCSAQGSD